MPSREDRRGDRTEPPADEVAAHAYADGYGEGLREGLRDVLQHASRGHTAQELRWLIESRLARVPEEVELKRRALLGPPRRVDWEALLRPPVARRSGPPTLETTLEGTSLLFREDRPARALSFVAARWRPYGRVVHVGPPGDPSPDVPPESLLRLPLDASGRASPEAGTLSPGEAAGRIDALLAEGTALVYVGGLAVQVREEGIDATQRFLEWLARRLRQRSGLLVASADPATFEEIDFRRIQAGFESTR